MRAILIFLAIFGIISSKAMASNDNCEQAIEHYNSVLRDLETNWKRYTSCINNSSGRDDCASPFRRVKSDQGDYEDAVSRLASDSCLQ
jgi:hypothetical protein